MELKLGVFENEYEESGKGFYYQNEYSLEYETNSYKIFDQFLLIYDTLTITFNSLNKKFISLDAFTNKKNWVYVDKIKLPEICRVGLLKILEGYENTDRYSFRFIPIYEYSNEGILKIKLTDDDSNSLFFQISNDLIVGIKNQIITSFIISKIYFI